jgi:hypothetical protein
MQDNTRIKIFTSSGPECGSVEQRINTWIEQNNTRIVDIKHSVNTNSFHVFMIIYETIAVEVR